MGRSTAQLLVLPLLLIAAVLSGCATDLRDAHALHASGRFQEAWGRMDQIDLRNRHDAIWVLLERGKIAQDSGRFEESSRALDRAWTIIQDVDDRAVVSASATTNDILSLLTDERARDYLASRPDRLFLHTTQAVNQLLLGEYELAAVYSRRYIDLAASLDPEGVGVSMRPEQFDRAASTRNVRLTSGRSVSVSSIESMPEYVRLNQRLRAAPVTGPADDAAPYGLFVGAVAMLLADRRAELQDFLVRLERLAPDLADAVRSAESQPTVFVLFENGRAPRREPVRSFPFGYAVGAIELPALVFDSGPRASWLEADADGLVARSVMLGSVEAAIASDFSSRLWEIWGRPILSAAIKITAGEVGAHQAEDDWISATIRAVWISAVLLARADTRTWRTLPAEHHALVVPAPSSGMVRLRLAGRSGTGRTMEVAVPPDRWTVVWVRSTGSGPVAVYRQGAGRVLTAGGR
ncbi:MAG: hypothetical protein JJU33_11415 [Phycisphaerales bacterium]|nr:hypothetical protein [Phycisphaerales bacterium]